MKQNQTVSTNWSLYYRNYYEPKFKRLIKRNEELYDENQKMKRRLEKYEGSKRWFCIIIKRRKMTREKGRQWDGRSRPPSDLYKKNFDEIFKKKKEKENDGSNEMGHRPCSYQKQSD